MNRRSMDGQPKDDDVTRNRQDSSPNDPPKAIAESGKDGSALGPDAPQFLDDLGLDDLGKEVLERISEFGGLPELDGESPGEFPLDARSQPAEEQLDEIADDMLQLMKRVQDIEASQKRLFTCFEELQSNLKQAIQSVARETDLMRREILGDRKHTATMNLYNEIIPLLERLRIMQRNMDEREDERTLHQLNSVNETLSASLRRLGCAEFQVNIGDAFDPARMECDGFMEEGESGIVLGVVRPGYLAGNTVIRPAGVLIADTRTVSTDNLGASGNE
jgi:molecular chaperone GrpE (heat shock protein)